MIPASVAASAERDPLDVLAEEAPRGGADAVHGEPAVLAEIDAVQVGGEDLVLPVAPLERDREGGLPDLPPPGPLGREHQVLDELLGEGAAALADAAATEVHPDRPRDRPDVDTVMLEEATVLGGHHGLDEVLRHGRERNRVAQLVGGAPEPRQRLGLELDLIQRLAGGGDELTDAGALEEQPDREGGPGRARVVPRPEMHLPEGGLPAELPRPRARCLGLTVPETSERALKIGGLDRHARGQDLTGGVDEGGVLPPGEIDARHGPPGPDAESDRRAEREDERDRQQEPAAPPGGAPELDQARGNPQRGKSWRHRGEGSEQRACRARRSVARPSLAASSAAARGAADAPAPAQGAEGVALTVSSLRVVSRPGR